MPPLTQSRFKRKKRPSGKGRRAFSRTKRRQKRPKHDTVEVSTQTGSGVGGGEARRVQDRRRQEKNEYSSDEDYSRGENLEAPLPAPSDRLRSAQVMAAAVAEA